jgi:hypothetical protein
LPHCNLPDPLESKDLSIPVDCRVAVADRDGDVVEDVVVDGLGIELDVNDMSRVGVGLVRLAA